MAITDGVRSGLINFGEVGAFLVLLAHDLDQVVRVRLLPGDDAEAGRERARRIVRREAPRHLVRGEEAEPDDELEREMEPAAR